MLAKVMNTNNLRNPDKIHEIRDQQSVKS